MPPIQTPSLNWIAGFAALSFEFSIRSLSFDFITIKVPQQEDKNVKGTIETITTIIKRKRGH